MTWTRPPLLQLALVLVCGPGDGAPRSSAGELPEGVVATIDGTPIGEREFFRFVGREFHSDEPARDLLEQMIKETAIRGAARDRGIEASNEALEQRFARLDAETREKSSGRSLIDVLEERGISRAQFLEGLRATLLSEELARLEFGLSTRADVPYEKTNVWLQDLMRRVAVVTRGLGEEVIARVDGVAITHEEFGRRYFDDQSPRGTGRSDLLTELIDTRIIENAARESGVTAIDAAMDAAIEDQRRAIARDPMYAGVTLEQVLEKTGRSVEMLKSSSRFRNRVLVERLVEKRYPGDGLREYYEAHRDVFDESHGPSVRVNVIFLRAGHTGAVVKGFVQRLYEDAEKELNALKERILDGGASFEELARRRSEERSRDRGGDIGFIRGSTPRLGEVAAAALAEPRDHHPIGPVRTVDGVYLVEVTARRPPPGFEEIEEDVKKHAAAALFQDLRSRVEIERRF